MKKSKISIWAMGGMLALALLFLPGSALGQNAQAQAIHHAIAKGGVHIDSLKVIPIEGIFIVRGNVHDAESYKRVSTVLSGMSHSRVANLVKITPLPDDEAIERAAERELLTTRAMDGARVTVQSRNGVVTINGKVRHELQRDAAINIVRGVDGVRQVQAYISKM